MATKQGYIRGAAQEVFRRQPKVKGLYKQGGIDRIESERPDKFGGRTRFVLWMFFLLSCACFVFVVPGLFAGTVLIPEIALLVHLLAVAWFSARQMEENPRGIVRHFFREGPETWWWSGALLMVVFSMEIRLLAEGLPASWSITEALQQLLVWAFPVAAFVGYVAAFVLGRHYVGFRNQTYDAMMTFEEILKSLQQPMTAQLHKSMRFRPREVRIKKVPVNLAARYNDIETAMAQGRFDEWMLDPVNSSPKQIIWIPTTEEWAERRDLLRASHNTVVKEYEDEVSDKEILGREVQLPEDAIKPEAISTPRPRAVLLHEGVRESDLAAAQNFAQGRGKTIVGVDLNRFDSATEMPEKTAFFQYVGDDLPLYHRVADLLKIKPWEFWMEIHRVENDGADKTENPLRIDTVIFRRLPALGLTPEAREKYIVPLAELVLGSDGGKFVDDQATGVVTMYWGPPLSFPDSVPYDWQAPVSYDWVPFGLNGYGEQVGLPLLETNILLGGLPGSGKSGGLTALLAGISRLPNCAIIGLDPKVVEQASWGPRFTRIATELPDALGVLTSLADEMDRRYTVLANMNPKRKKVSADMLEMMPLIVVVADELAELVAMGVTKEEKAADLDRVSKLQRLVQKGRAAGIAVIGATQKPGSDVIPTRFRDLVQQRAAYATTNSDMTDTILGKGMSSAGGTAHDIAGGEKGVCYLVNENSRTPQKVLTYWVPDEDVEGIAARTAHLRVELPFLNSNADMSVEPSEDELDELAKLLRE